MTNLIYKQNIHKKQSDITKSPQKCLITQRLLADLGHSVRVTTAIKLVWLAGLRVQPFQPPNQLCNQTEIIIIPVLVVASIVHCTFHGQIKELVQWLCNMVYIESICVYKIHAKNPTLRGDLITPLAAAEDDNLHLWFII